MNQKSAQSFKLILIYWLSLILAILQFSSTNAQALWDDTTTAKWKKPFQKISIISKLDKSLQPAYFYASTATQKQPLIVSLHSWSGNFEQMDSIAEECIQRNWNYIHPNFRGENNHPEAAGSSLAISDIKDAISFAIEHGNVDTNEIHIVGASGGGHAAMMCYFSLPFIPKSIHAWVGISDLEEWYWESLGRKQKYATDLLKIAAENPNNSSIEWRKRSPMYQIPNANRARIQLYLYAGIHDGYQGSVPISHSIRLYNKLASFWCPNQSDKLVSDSLMMQLLIRRYAPESKIRKPLATRPVHLFKEAGPVSLVIFEGKHEAIAKACLSLIKMPYVTTPPINIVCLGDSNGENLVGWVNNLHFKLPTASILNLCKSGNTFGYFNNGNSKLNQLHNIESDLDQAQIKFQSSPVDFIIIGLGTNDAKFDFDTLQEKNRIHIKELQAKIKNHSIFNPNHTQIIWITPPPIKEELIQTTENKKKYFGASERVKRISEEIRIIAKNDGDTVIDLQELLSSDWKTLQRDGIHYNTIGAERSALLISNLLFQQLIKTNKRLSQNEKITKIQGWNILSNDPQKALQTINLKNRPPFKSFVK